MPYIKQERRDELLPNYGLLLDRPQNAGELNYIFTVIALEYLESKGERYQNYNDILGALEGCKLELYRRKCAGYEDEKIKSNGDVFV